MLQAFAKRKPAVVLWLALLCACVHAALGRQQASVPAVPELIDGSEVIPDEPLEGTIVSDGSADNRTRNAPTGPCYEPGTSCAPRGSCGPIGRFWLRDEYVAWWATPGRVPTLLATSPDGSLPAGETLYGDARFNGGFRSGDWFQGGAWFDGSGTNGLMGDYFFVGQISSPFSARSNGDPVITRPFIDANTSDGMEQLIAFPGIVHGSVAINNFNSMVGAGGAWRHNICCWCDWCGPCRGGCAPGCGRVDFVAGFRYYRFGDNLGVAEQLTSVDPQASVPVGTQATITDSFRTLNNFYGAELGLVFDRYWSRWMFEGAGRVGLGTTQQIVSIDGSTSVTLPGQPTTFSDGGLLALSSNMGQHVHNSFSVIPQISTRLGYRLTPRLTMLVGYTAIYWDRVARAGDQIDTAINPNLISQTPGGPNRPGFTLQLSDLLLQGLTVGGQYCF